MQERAACREGTKKPGRYKNLSWRGFEMSVELEVVGLEPIMTLLRKDLREAALNLSPHDIRFLVDTYYQIQDYRCQAANQTRSQLDSGEPNAFIRWIYKTQFDIEKRIKAVLDYYTDNNPLGNWAKSIVGIGPVIAAGLLAHMDAARTPTAGGIWRFAGLDPSIEWLGKERARELVEEVLGRTAGPVSEEEIAAVAAAAGRKPEGILRLWPASPDGEPKPRTAQNLIAALAKRPWNAKLKVLCWKIGESFVKTSNKPESFYGRLYRERKEYETRKNEAGEYAEQAARILKTKKIGRDTVAYSYYAKGMLPPGHIHARAKRWAVKLFLSHYHEAAYFLEHGVLPPNPYPLVHLGHVHYIAPPNMELIPGWREARERLSSPARAV